MSDVESKARAGDYKSKLEYPEAPSMPRLPMKATPAQHREYADKLEAYEAAKLANREKIRAYNADTTRLENQFREDLEAEYGMKGHPKADKLFSMAWDRGHSSGLASVALEYDELHELITPIK